MLPAPEFDDLAEDDDQVLHLREHLTPCSVPSHGDLGVVGNAQSEC